MKAVLVMDMPSKCFVCKRSAFSHFYGRICMATEEHREVSDARIVQDWCPLRPLPDKATPENSDMGISWNLGWNACLDAITGGEKRDDKSDEDNRSL